MNELKIFNNTDFGKLTVNQTNDTIYFFLGEVCRHLGYTKQAKGNTYLRKDKIENICESLEIKGLSPSDNFEQVTIDTDFDTTRITEDALYDLILESKAKNARKFLEDGDKVKITVRFRGREMELAHRGVKILENFTEKLSDVSAIEKPAKREGRSMAVILSPKKA